MATSLTEADIRSYAAFAETLADAAAAVTLKYFRQPVDVINKAEGAAYDPVTRADRDAESEIRRLIAARYPDHAIIGEEHGSSGDNSGGARRLSWVIDPVDGTRAFISGLPLWGTLIALHDGTRPVIGVIDHPATGERLIGIPGQAWMKEARGGQRVLKTRACDDLRHAVLSTTDPALFTAGAETAAYDAVAARVRLTRYGYDCYAYGMLALGFIDIVVEAGLQPYDVQALIPVIEGAGGIITSWSGGPADQGGQIIAAGDSRIHQQALAILRDAATDR